MENETPSKKKTSFISKFSAFIISGAACGWVGAFMFVAFDKMLNDSAKDGIRQNIKSLDSFADGMKNELLYYKTKGEEFPPTLYINAPDAELDWLQEQLKPVVAADTALVLVKIRGRENNLAITQYNNPVTTKTASQNMDSDCARLWEKVAELKKQQVQKWDQKFGQVGLQKQWLVPAGPPPWQTKAGIKAYRELMKNGHGYGNPPQL